MAGPMALQGNIRPRRSETPSEMDYEHYEDPYTGYESEDDPYSVPQSVQNGVKDTRQSDVKESHDEDDDEDEDEEEEKDESADDEDGEEVQQQISQTSFAALKQAQDAMLRKRKRGSDTNEDQEEKLAALRSRLKDLREKADSTRTSKVRSRNAEPNVSGKHVQDHDSEDEGSDSAPSEEGAPMKSRTSKHAPASQSTRYQVTRKRTVIDAPKRTYRDPRFDALHNQPTNLQDNSEKAYAFLTDYQKSEIKELRSAIKATKNEDEKETLRRKMVSMENRLKSKAAKERERDVVRKHRREEREKVEQGKQPYYLKEKEIKQKALEEKFKGMKGKEREKLMERRRKKEGQREKKRMPMARRVER